MKPPVVTVPVDVLDFARGARSAPADAAGVSFSLTTGAFADVAVGISATAGSCFDSTFLGSVRLGAGVGVGGIPTGERGRSRSRQRELDERYDEEVHGGSGALRAAQNPFGDDAEAASLRAASPRPVVETGRGTRGVSAHKRGQSSLGTQGSHDDSPTERRSMFREDV